MGKYEALAKDIVKNVGGKDNVAGLVHCITRLRFTLKDDRNRGSDQLSKSYFGENKSTICSLGHQFSQNPDVKLVCVSHSFCAGLTSCSGWVGALGS